jgi:hypothetical protein
VNRCQAGFIFAALRENPQRESPCVNSLSGAQMAGTSCFNQNEQVFLNKSFLFDMPDEKAPACDNQWLETDSRNQIEQ